MNIWLQFALCAGVILCAGMQLTRQGDVIAARTGLGGSWIGLVLLATVTSLPELISGVSAVTLNDLPDMAVSGILGSCMFNVLVIAALDLFSKNRPVSYMVHQGHILSAGFAIVLIGLVALDILFGKRLPVITCFNSLDPLSLVFVATYLLAMKMIYGYERQRVQEFVGEIVQVAPAETLFRAVIMFVLNAVAIVVAACFLPELGAQIASSTGLGQSFVGSSFIAITTSLPEITVSITAARMGAFDMAVANLLGSNVFNVVILTVVDFAYARGPLLRSVCQTNSLLALATVIAMGIAVIGLTYRSEKKFWLLAGDAIAILLVYALASILLFLSS